MPTQLGQIASLLNARQAVITNGRAAQKAAYIENDTSKSGEYVSFTNGEKSAFNKANADRVTSDDDAKLEIADAFETMRVRALTLIEVEPEVMQNSIAEAELLLAAENANLAADIIAATTAIDDLDAAARLNFGFSEIDAAVATIENALSGSTFVIAK
jgi:hypothetical protein